MTVTFQTQLTFPQPLLVHQGAQRPPQQPMAAQRCPRLPLHLVAVPLPHQNLQQVNEQNFRQLPTYSCLILSIKCIHSCLVLTLSFPLHIFPVSNNQFTHSQLTVIIKMSSFGIKNHLVTISKALISFRSTLSMYNSVYTFDLYC